MECSIGGCFAIYPDTWKTLYQHQKFTVDPTPGTPKSAIVTCYFLRAMRRVVHSSTRSSIRRLRRNGALKRSRLLSVRCGLLVTAGVLFLLMFLEFIVLYRHKTNVPVSIDIPNSSRGTLTSDRRWNSRRGKDSTLDSTTAFGSDGKSQKPKATKNIEKPEDTVWKRLPPREELDLQDLPEETKFAYDGMRVAVLVPYSGPGLPNWFDAFTDLAAASRDAVDWIIFCEEVYISQRGS